MEHNYRNSTETNEEKVRIYGQNGLGILMHHSAPSQMLSCVRRGRGAVARARGRGEVDVRQVEAHLLPVKDCEIVVSQESPSVSLRAEGRPKDDDIF